MKNEEVIEILDIGDKIDTMPKVNLDALIPKSDFAEDKTIQGATELKILNIQHLMPRDTSPTSKYHLFRKPDFQRETNNWDKKRIKELIECYIDESFIPSIILWQNPSTKAIYVIDGAHRLSALLAWINNDYGDGTISQEYYKYTPIPDAERELAIETRTYIDDAIGSFKKISAETGLRWDTIINRNLDIQIITGDVKKAEDSFFKINQQGVVISTTERHLCKHRDEPISISTRIILKGGAGHQYWKGFTTENIGNVPSIAEDLHTLLFKPAYNEESISTILHHPLAGSVPSGMAVAFELVNVISSEGKADEKNKINDSLNGTQTLNILLATRKICRTMLSQEVGSLGLFPSIYFYNSVGKFIEGAFLGMAQLLQEKDKSGDANFKILFTKARKDLELFLVNNKVFLTQINRKFGSADKSTRQFKGFFENLIKIINELYEKKYSEEVLIKALKAKYEFLNENELDYKKPKSGKPSIEQKRALRIKEEILSQPKCKICKGIIHPLSKDYDHKKKHETGGRGLSDMDNLQTTHIYCNNSRAKLEQIGFYIATT
jgi:uncharacterized protein DUF262